MDVLFVGVGSIGQKEIRELRDESSIRLVGAVEPVAARRNSVAGSVPETFHTVEEALEAVTPDLVRVTTPPQTHHEISLQAIQAGADVYVEKIMTTTAAEARDLVECAAENGSRIFVRRNAIYTPVYRRAWNALDSIGTVRDVHWVEPTGRYTDWSESKATWLQELPGGIVSEHLPHALYVVRWFMTDEPTVTAVETGDLGVTVALRGRDQTATITFTEPADLPMLFRVVGSDGVLDVNHSSFRIHRPRGFERYGVEGRTVLANAADLLGSLQNIVRLSELAVRRALGTDPGKRYSRSDIYRQFMDIVTGAYESRPFRIDGEEGLRNVELFEQIWNAVEVERAPA